MHLVNAQKGENWGAAVQEESSSQHVQPEQLTEECPCQKNHASLEPKHTPASTNPHPERELLKESPAWIWARFRPQARPSILFMFT